MLIDHRYRRGDWDEAHRSADDFLAHIEAGATHTSAWQVFANRAELRLAKGDTAGAIADAEQALSAGRAVGEVQALTFVLAACTHVFQRASEQERAHLLARELLESLLGGMRMQFAVINLPAFTTVADQMGLSADLAKALAGHPDSRWSEVARAYLAGNFVGAAELLRQAGARPDEAEIRLRAAKQLAAEGRRGEADAQLQRALTFYRSVGATRYLQEAETLLAASA